VTSHGGVHDRSLTSAAAEACLKTYLREMTANEGELLQFPVGLCHYFSFVCCGFIIHFFLFLKYAIKFVVCKR
jgi:hypothetical protein